MWLHFIWSCVILSSKYQPQPNGYKIKFWVLHRIIQVKNSIYIYIYIYIYIDKQRSLIIREYKGYSIPYNEEQQVVNSIYIWFLCIKKIWYSFPERHLPLIDHGEIFIFHNMITKKYLANICGLNFILKNQNKNKILPRNLR
jgi:hypothetical protein